MQFYVQLPSGIVEIWDHNRWYHNFILPGLLSDDRRYDWAPIDGSNYTTSVRDRLRAIYNSQPSQISFFSEDNL